MLVDEKAFDIRFRDERVLVHKGKDPCEGAPVHEVHGQPLPHEDFFRIQGPLLGLGLCLLPGRGFLLLHRGLLPDLALGHGGAIVRPTCLASWAVHGVHPSPPRVPNPVPTREEVPPRTIDNADSPFLQGQRNLELSERRAALRRHDDR